MVIRVMLFFFFHYSIPTPLAELEMVEVHTFNGEYSNFEKYHKLLN